jgi:hypothetical protein
MTDDRWQTAWGLENLASRDGARLLIKAIKDRIDDQNRVQPAGMEDERRETLVAASESISEAFEYLAALFIEPHAATNQTMVKAGYGLLYKLILSSFGAGSGSTGAIHEKLKFLKEKQSRLKQKEIAWRRWQDDIRPWWGPVDALAQQIREGNDRASPPKIAEEIVSRHDPQFPGYETLLPYIRKMIKDGNLAPAKKDAVVKKRGKRGE